MDTTALLGQPLAALPTPALIVDAAALAHNLGLLATYFAGRPAKLRPHFKSHKCVTLAHRQMAAGACVGLTCAKLGEAEALVAGGIGDVLIANQVVGPAKAARLAALNRQAVVRSAVDCAANVTELGRAAVAAGVIIPVLVEVDIGMGRCGVAPGAATVALARQVAATPGLRFAGLQGYEGHLITKPDPAERRALVTAAMQPLLAQRALLTAAGLPCPLISGGGTGTYDITGDLPGIDEVQAGSYALMDCFYQRLRPEFRLARTVLATVISASPGKAVADVGLKGMGNEFGLPEVAGQPQAKVRYVAEEHTVIDGLEAAVGERLQLIPSHGCTTNNLHRRMWLVRDGRLAECWPIEAAGALE
jgi:D-serine deaminase-like pyridoxal phosphate-dependent protein